MRKVLHPVEQVVVTDMKMCLQLGQFMWGKNDQLVCGGLERSQGCTVLRVDTAEGNTGFSREYGTPWRGARRKVEELTRTRCRTRALAVE